MNVHPKKKHLLFSVHIEIGTIFVVIRVVFDYLENQLEKFQFESYEEAFNSHPGLCSYSLL